MGVWDNGVIPARPLRQRKLIRKKIIEILTGTTDAGARVWANQSTPAWEEQLALGPMILVYPRSEGAETYAIAPRELKRTLDLAVEIIAAGPEADDEKSGAPSLSDILDDVSHQVECELSRDDTVGCTASDIQLTNTEFEFTNEGAVPFGSARLLYTVTYYTNVPEDIAKQTVTPDFTTAASDWHVGHHDDDPDLTNTEANDEVDIPII